MQPGGVHEYPSKFSKVQSAWGTSEHYRVEKGAGICWGGVAVFHAEPRLRPSSVARSVPAEESFSLLNRQFDAEVRNRCDELSRRHLRVLADRLVN